MKKLALLFLLLALGACGPKKASKAPPSNPEALYRQGLTYLNQGRYKRAEEAFSRLKSYFPEREDLVARAELRLADCAYLSEDYEEAISRYTEFRKRYPFHPDRAYAEFQIAMAYFEQMNPKDRDQEVTRKALATFERVLRNYPGTLFAEKASEKAALCRRRLAEHEIYVGNFYLKKKKLKAAADRFRTALAYKGTGLEAQALYLLGLALHRMGRDAEAASYLAMLERKFPQGKYTDKARELKGKLKVQKVEEVGLPPAALLLPSRPEEGRLRITAQRQERTSGGRILYSGDVRLSWQGLSLRAEEAQLLSVEGRPAEVVLKGDVKASYRQRDILCRRAKLDLKAKVLVLEGNPRYNEAGTIVRGSRMILDLDSGRLDIEGKRVERIEEELR